MDPAVLHHFDGTGWNLFGVGTYTAFALWHVGTTFWVAAPGQALGQKSLVRYDGTLPATAVAVTGGPMDGSSLQFERLWGRGPSDLYAAGTDLVHFDGTDWTVVADAPPPAHGSRSAYNNTFVSGDPAAVWIVTIGPRFFRKLTAGAAGP